MAAAHLLKGSAIAPAVHHDCTGGETLALSLADGVFNSRGVLYSGPINVWQSHNFGQCIEPC